MEEVYYWRALRVAVAYFSDASETITAQFLSNLFDIDRGCVLRDLTRYRKAYKEWRAKGYGIKAWENTDQAL